MNELTISPSAKAHAQSEVYVLPSWLPPSIKHWLELYLPKISSEERKAHLLRIATADELRELWKILQRKKRSGEFMYPAQHVADERILSKVFDASADCQEQALTMTFIHVDFIVRSPGKFNFHQRKQSYDALRKTMEERATFLAAEAMLSASDPEVSDVMLKRSLYWSDGARACEELAQKSAQYANENIQALNTALFLSNHFNITYGDPLYKQAIKAASLAGAGAPTYDQLRRAWRFVQLKETEAASQLAYLEDVTHTIKIVDRAWDKTKASSSDLASSL